MANRAKAQSVINKLNEKYPNAHCQLHFSNPFQLLIATILSAQCTDERVNSVTAVLFEHYPRPQDLAKAVVKDVESVIRPTGFFRMKAKNIVHCSKKIVTDHQGQIPRTIEELILLPGVGRKTANVVLGNAFGISSGVVVDTHVSRLSHRLGWTRHQSAEKIEKDLQDFIPQDHWIQLSHWLIWHGRNTCKARKPLCERCILFDLCPRVGVK